MIKALACQIELAPFKGAGTGDCQWQNYGLTSSHSNVGYTGDRPAQGLRRPVQRLPYASQASPTSHHPRPGFGWGVGAVSHASTRTSQMPIWPLKRRGLIQ